MRRGILWSASFYPIKTQIRLIMACFLLHNYIRNEMSVDPAEVLFDSGEGGQEECPDIPDMISTIELTAEWNGYLTKIEIALRKAFPSTNLQETPHITSKITTWPKHYSSIVCAKMLATGVGFNTTTNQLECTDDLWDAIMKKDPPMRGMCHKEWSYFVDWINIFGKDRATNESAEEVPEAIGEMDGPNHNPNVNNTQESNDDNEFDAEG
ncbi:hypothetical protein ACS0TY_031031 [Phlomoides rotata]